MEQVILKPDYEYVLIPDYYGTAGPLAEFDPNIIMSDIVQDVNDVINRAVTFMTEDTIGDLIWHPFKNTINTVGTLLADHNHTLDSDSVLEYGKYMRSLASNFLDSYIEKPNWISNYPKWVAAQHAANCDGVEILLDMNQVKYPNLTNQELQRSLTPQMHYMVNQLFGFSEE